VAQAILRVEAERDRLGEALREVEQKLANA
jgi:hypothetical protein